MCLSIHETNSEEKHWLKMLNNSFGSINASNIDIEIVHFYAERESLVCKTIIYKLVFVFTIFINVL